VFKAQTTRDLEELLRSCVTEGYGVGAAIDGYDAVGKTGTAEKSNTDGGYEANLGQYVCSFAGYIDNSNSNYVFMSSFENPTNYADSPATTFFSVVMSFVANRYLIEPQAEAPLVGELLAASGTELVGEVDSASTVDSASEAGAQSSGDGAAVAVKPEQSSVEPPAGSLVRPTPKARDWLLDTSG
jgi:membrane peptidoglycan carboxypeptidase